MLPGKLLKKKYFSWTCTTQAKDENDMWLCAHFDFSNYQQVYPNLLCLRCNRNPCHPTYSAAPSVVQAERSSLTSSSVSVRQDGHPAPELLPGALEAEADCPGLSHLPDLPCNFRSPSAEAVWLNQCRFLGRVGSSQLRLLCLVSRTLLVTICNIHHFFFAFHLNAFFLTSRANTQVPRWSFFSLKHLLGYWRICIYLYIYKRRNWWIIFPVLERHCCKHVFCPLCKKLHVALLKRKGHLFSWNFVILRGML